MLIAYVLLGITCLLGMTVPVQAQDQSPDVDVSGIYSEFISDNVRASFVIRGARTIGAVDTLTVAIQPSGVRTKNGEIRYKPVFDSLRRNGTSIDVYMHLTGKGLPLPADSVRGMVRFEYRGIGKLAGSKAKFISPAEVLIANVTLPKPGITISEADVQPVTAKYKGAFAITNIKLRKPLMLNVEGMKDYRTFERDTLIATLVKSSLTNTAGDKDYKADINYVTRAPDGSYIIGCMVDLGKGPITKVDIIGSVTLQLETRFWSRGVMTRKFQKEVFDVKSE